MEWWSIDCNSLRLSHRHSTTPSLRTLQSIRQERGIGGFEMDVLRQFRRLEAQDEDVCARPELSAGFRSGIGRFRDGQLLLSAQCLGRGRGPR